MVAGIAKYYYWPGMATNLQQFVTSCDTCQRMKSSKQKKAGLLQPLPIPEQPWQVVSLDFITGLPSTSRGHNAILVVIDKFSKMGHFIPTNATATTKATARLFFDRIITIDGIPATLISEGDPKFSTEEAKMASYRSTSNYIDAVPPPGMNVASGRWLYKIAAEEVEMASYRSTGTYVDAVPPPGTNVVSGPWRYKTFTPTPKMTTLRVLLHIAAHHNYELHSLDFSTEQAPREWHDTLRSTLAALDFFPSSANLSLFVRCGSTPFFVLVYVDDLVFATQDGRALASVKEELQRRHTCTDLGELQHYLGLHVTRDRAARTIMLTQSHMVKQILMRFRFPFSKVQLTPIAVDRGLMAPPSDESFESSGPYPEGPAPTLGPEREHYFLVVVDDYSRYTKVFFLTKKSEMTFTLIRWLLATEGTRGSHVCCLHFDSGGEFCSGVIARFCGEQGIRQSWTLPESPQQNGVAERRIGLVMDIARTSMIHARAPHFLWPYALRYAAHQLNLQPRASRPEDILTWKEAIEPQLEMAGLINFARGAVVTPDDPDLRAEFRAVQLLTFMVISRCCSPGVQIALKWCREYLDAGHQAWHFIESTYQVTDDLFIAQLEGQLTHLRMGDEETTTDYCNRTRRILATIRMAGAQYSTASYVTHVMQGLSSNYNLLKRLSMASGTRTTLNEDNLTSYILQDEAMQEAERSQELLAQANFAAPTKQGGRPGGRGGGGRSRECWLCGDPDHLSFECPDRSDSDNDDTKGGRGRSGSRRPRRGGNQPRKKKQSTKTSTSAKDADSSAGGKVRDDKTASCSLVGVVEPTVSLAPEAGEDFQAVAAAVQANPAVVLLDSGCSHHLMGTKEVFVDLQPSGSIKHVRGFNGALQDVQGRGTVALQGEAGKLVLIPDVLYVPGVRANLLSSGQMKEHGVKLQEDGDGMLLVSAAGEVLGRATYSGQVLCTDLRPCPTRSTSPAPEVVALRAIVSKTKSTPDRMHARLAHVGMDTIRSSAKNEVAIGLDLESATGADSLSVVHIDLCGPFRVAAKDGSLYFLLLKDRKTRFVWVRPVAKKSDVLLEFQKWLVLVERQTKKSVLQLRSDRGGEFLGKKFTDFVDGQGIVHDLTCPYTPQQNGMAEREMRTVVESVRTMLLHMGVQHHWWHLALRQAVWVRNCLERSTLPPGTTPYQLLTGQRPDLSLAWIWGCMTQFLVPEQQRGGKLKPKARWGLHLGVSAASKGWELLDVDTNRVVTTSDVVFYEAMSWAEWKSEHGTVSGRTPSTPPTDTSSATLPLLTEVGELAAEDVEDVSPPTPPSTAPAPPLLADQQVDVGLKPTSIGEEQVKEQQSTGEQAAVQPTTEQLATEHSVGKSTTGERSARKTTVVQQDNEGSEARDAGESTKSDVVEVRLEPRKSDRVRRPPDFFVPAAFTTVYEVDNDDDLLYDDAEEDEDFLELDPKHRWDISAMTVKEALASSKGPAVKAAMEEEIRSLINMGTWELVERPPGVNIMKNRWVLMTKYHVNDTVEREKARLVVKGFTRVYGDVYDKTFAPVGSYVTLRIFLSIAAVLNLNLMQLDMKNAFLQSKLDRVLYMSQPDYFNDGTGRVCKLLKSLYGLKQSPLLWYLALKDVLVGAGWKMSHVDEALYFKVGKDGVACWVLVYVDDLLAASSSTEMLKELKELLESAFELREISPVQKYLGLEIVRDRSARKLWLHQQGYADKLRRRFIDEEQTGRTPKTPVSVDAYAELTFDDKEAQERQEEVYRQKVGSLQFAATTTRPDVAFACSKLGSGLTVRSDQHWREVDRCLTYLANMRDSALEFSDGPESLELVGYVDADDAGDKQNRMSMGGYVFVYGGAAVSWSSQRIKCATLSSTESEYVAATEAGKEGRRLRFLLAEFQQLDAGKPTIL
ncbi:unnamed protein product [Closterium sp. NIES-53]